MGFMKRHFIGLTLLALSTAWPISPVWAEADLKPMTELPSEAPEMTDKMKRVINEISQNSQLTPDTARMLFKAGHADTLEWIDKEAAMKPSHRFLDDEDVPDYLRSYAQDLTDPKQRGLISLRQGGLDSNLWKNMSKTDIQAAFDQIKGYKTVTTSQLEALRLILISAGNRPSGFNRDEFDVFRLNHLLDFGFFTEALAFYKLIAQLNERENDGTSRDFLQAGLTSFIVNNQFDGACIELRLHENLWANAAPASSNDQNAEPVIDYFQTLASLCDLYLKDDARPNSDGRDSEDGETAASERPDIKTISPLLYKTKGLQPLVVFMTGTVNQTGLMLKANMDKLESLYPVYQKAFLMQEAVPSSLRHSLFKQLAKRVYFSAVEYRTLFAFDEAYPALIGHHNYQAIVDEENATLRLTMIEERIKANKNPTAPLSRLYLRRARVVKANEQFKDYAAFLAFYFGANNQPERFERWSPFIPADKIIGTQKQLADITAENNSFFIFLLANWPRVMLKETVLVDPTLSKDYVNKENKGMRFQESLRRDLLNMLAETSIPDQKDPAIETPTVPDNNRPLKDAFTNFERAAASGDTAKTVIMSIVAWNEALKSAAEEKDKDQKAQKTKDLLPYAKFILHRLSKSDLNNYTLSFGFDLITK